MSCYHCELPFTNLPQSARIILNGKMRSPVGSLNMHTLVMTSLLLFAIPLLQGSAWAASEVASFSKLPKGDTIRMIFRSQGCFGGGNYELVFKKTTNVLVTISALTIYPAYPDRPAQTNIITQVGEVNLTESELRGLDKLLAFYRSRPRGWCTTVDRIHLTQMREKEVIASEQFVDGSCASDRIEGIVTVWTLILKAMPQ